MTRKTRRLLRQAASGRNLLLGAGVAAGLTLGILAARRWRRNRELLAGPGELTQDEPLVPAAQRNVGTGGGLPTGGDVVPQL